MNDALKLLDEVEQANIAWINALVIAPDTVGRGIPEGLKYHKALDKLRKEINKSILPDMSALQPVDLASTRLAIFDEDGGRASVVDWHTWPEHVFKNVYIIDAKE